MGMERKHVAKLKPGAAGGIIGRAKTEPCASCALLHGNRPASETPPAMNGLRTFFKKNYTYIIICLQHSSPSPPMPSESLEDCREKALRLLENSPHSVCGLKRKLFNAKKFSSQDIQTVIDDLLKAKLLDDAQFAANYIDYLKTTGIGRFKAVFKLKSKGVSPDIIQEAMEKQWETGDDDDDSERASEAAKIKWRSLKNKKDWPDIKKIQAVARFLAGRGFSPSIIRHVVDDLKMS